MSGYAEFSIGEALDAFDAQRQAEREAAHDEGRLPDALDDYAATLTATAHPPNECGDPYSCPTHGDQYRAYHAERGER